MNAKRPLTLAFSLGLLAHAHTAGAQDRFDEPARQPPEDPRQSQPLPREILPPDQTRPAPPARPTQPQTPPPGFHSRTPAVDLVYLAQIERQDYGVPPTGQLHAGALHGPTPTTIPGGALITTAELLELLHQPDGQALLFDVLGADEILPGAVSAVAAHQPGSFSDHTQQQFGQYLEQITGGEKNLAMVFYCMSTYCWMSYNAALRAINLGYTNVLWYRGGLDAWKQAGQAVQQAPPGNR